MEKITRRQLLFIGGGIVIGGLKIAESRHNSRESTVAVSKTIPTVDVEEPTSTPMLDLPLKSYGLPNIVTESQISVVGQDVLELDVFGHMPDEVIDVFENKEFGKTLNNFQATLYSKPSVPNKMWGLKVTPPAPHDNFSVMTELFVPEESIYSNTGVGQVPLVELEELVVDKFVEKQGEVDIVLVQANNTVAAEQFTAQYVNGAAFVPDPDYEVAINITVTVDNIPYSAIQVLPQKQV